MVTGDHPITAKSIARMVGIIGPGMQSTYVCMFCRNDLNVLIFICTISLGSITSDEKNDMNIDMCVIFSYS